MYFQIFDRFVFPYLNSNILYSIHQFLRLYYMFVVFDLFSNGFYSFECLIFPNNLLFLKTLIYLVVLLKDSITQKEKHRMCICSHDLNYVENNLCDFIKNNVEFCRSSTDFVCFIHKRILLTHIIVSRNIEIIHSMKLCCVTGICWKWIYVIVIIRKNFCVASCVYYHFRSKKI